MYMIIYYMHITVAYDIYYILYMFMILYYMHITEAYDIYYIL